MRSQLRTLSKVAADGVARHLVAAGRLVDDDPQAALQHARAARALGSRVAVVREAVGETAYAAGEWAEAIAELRTARRMTGDDSALPMIADSERALGRADRALRLAQSEEAQALAPADRAEMLIVEAGARRDLGQLDAALLTLQDSGLDRRTVEPWSARVWYAYADLLIEAGREDEAREWFTAAAGADRDGSTDADERLLVLDGVEILSDEDEYDQHAEDGTGLGESGAEPGGSDPDAAEGQLDGPAAESGELGAGVREAGVDAEAGEPSRQVGGSDSDEPGSELAGTGPESDELDAELAGIGPESDELDAEFDGIGPESDATDADPGGDLVDLYAELDQPDAGLDDAEAELDGPDQRARTGGAADGEDQPDERMGSRGASGGGGQPADGAVVEERRTAGDARSERAPSEMEPTRPGAPGDAGSRDAESRDAGSRDAGPRDGGPGGELEGEDAVDGELEGEDADDRELDGEDADDGELDGDGAEGRPADGGPESASPITLTFSDRTTD